LLPTRAPARAPFSHLSLLLDCGQGIRELVARLRKETSASGQELRLSGQLMLGTVRLYVGQVMIDD
jgi:hypothetical protein